MCKPLKRILARFFRVVARFEKLHEGQGKDQGGGKTHNRHRKENNCLKIFEVLEEGGRQVRQEIRVDFSAVECKENGKDNRGDKTDRYPCHKAFSIRKLPAQFQLVILDGFINSETGDNPVKQAVKNIGVEVK